MRSISFLGPKRQTRINEWCTRSSLQHLSRPSIITSRLFLSTACAGITPASLPMGPIFYMCRVCRDHVSPEPFLYTCRITRPCTSQSSVTYRTTGLTPSHMSDQRDFPSLKVAKPMNYINSDINRYLLKCNNSIFFNCLADGQSERTDGKTDGRTDGGEFNSPLLHFVRRGTMSTQSKNMIKLICGKKNKEKTCCMTNVTFHYFKIISQMKTNMSDTSISLFHF